MKTAIGLALLMTALPASAKGEVKIERNSPALEFGYRWSREAAAIPALNRKLHAKADAAFAEARRYAREDQASAKTDKREFHQHYFSANWETAGQTPRLLSLEASLEDFTGGAHPNHNFTGDLWDKRLNRSVAIADLFSRSTAFGALTRTAYCKALDKERRKRRQGEKIDGPFSDCPKVSELTIVPTDKNRNARFDRLDFVAAPYTAGPYAEGEYSISLPVTRQLIAAIKPLYRASFEAQRQ